MTNSITLSQTQRLDNFLGSYRFFSNSIDFRIKSSKLIEKFKNVQSFQLNQLSNGKFYFEKDRKEILLLKYDMWTRWIYEVENYLIEMSSESEDLILTTNHMNFLKELAFKTSDVYSDIIFKKHPDKFNQDFSSIWHQCHTSSFDFLIESFDKVVGYRFDIGFSVIIQNLLDLMQYTLIEIHELNDVFKMFEGTPEKSKGIPCLIFSDYDDMYHASHKEHLIVLRLKTYLKHFNIKELYIKNYSDRPFDMRVFDTIEELGIKINYRMNF